MAMIMVTMTMIMDLGMNRTVAKEEGTLIEVKVRFNHM